MDKIRLLAVTLIIVFALSCTNDSTKETKEGEINLAAIAIGESRSGFGGGDYMARLSDGKLIDDTEDVRDNLVMLFSRRRTTEANVNYRWTEPVSFSEVRIHWYSDTSRISLPKSIKLSVLEGDDFVPLEVLSGLEINEEKKSILKFETVETTSLRLEVENEEGKGSGISEWEVITYEGGEYPPIVNAGIDRSVLIGGNTYLSGNYRSIFQVDKLKWKKISGPGKVNFEDAGGMETKATFSKIGEYKLALNAYSGKQIGSSELIVKVTEGPPEKRLDVVYTRRYKIDNPLWNSRAKAIIVNWIPWCIDQINKSDLETGQGGIDNFIEAGKALRGEPYEGHKGYVFSNAWVHQTIESMSIALMVDPLGDPDIISAQEKMKKTIEEWIPIILAAQEPDGYLQTAFTLRDTTRWQERWSPRNRSTHEGYVAGYFIESAINHYTLTEGTDTRLYDAAKKLADCWVDNIGPGKNEWFDGHQEMEQALVRFGRFVNDMEGNDRGDSYIDLAKFLLDNRGGGSEYDQSHLPVQQQYEAVGHAVRAVYNYSGMADVAAETGDIDYQSAVMSLWESMVNKKYYVTGGVGSGETSEGFGPDYSLRHNAYCESCSSCGLIFFQYKMNLAYHDAKYADLYEETMYNALMGSLDLEGKNFYYTNPMTQRNERYSWHGCPCCVGNIPRTLLMIPTWTYVTGDDGLYVNLFIGGEINIENVAGTNVRMVQKTDYPWDGKVSVEVNPEVESNFNVYIRVPDRQTSVLYKAVPEVRGLVSISVNGETIEPKIEHGYAVVNRSWKEGDRIDFEVPMEVQVISSDSKIVANEGLVALRYGPLVFSVENVDQEDISGVIGDAPFTTEWREDLLGGIMTIKGMWIDESPLMAIPYYTRLNRVTGVSEGDERRVTNQVWIRKE